MQEAQLAELEELARQVEEAQKAHDKEFLKTQVPDVLEVHQPKRKANAASLASSSSTPMKKKISLTSEDFEEAKKAPRTPAKMSETSLRAPSKKAVKTPLRTPSKKSSKPSQKAEGTAQKTPSRKPAKTPSKTPAKTPSKKQQKSYMEEAEELFNDEKDQAQQGEEPWAAPLQNGEFDDEKTQDEDNYEEINQATRSVLYKQLLKEFEEHKAQNPGMYSKKAPVVPVSHPLYPAPQFQDPIPPKPTPSPRNINPIPHPLYPTPAMPEPTRPYDQDPLYRPVESYTSYTNNRSYTDDSNNPPSKTASDIDEEELITEPVYLQKRLSLNPVPHYSASVPSPSPIPTPAPIISPDTDDVLPIHPATSQFSRPTVGLSEANQVPTLPKHFRTPEKLFNKSTSASTRALREKRRVKLQTPAANM